MGLFAKEATKQDQTESIDEDAIAQRISNKLSEEIIQKMEEKLDARLARHTQEINNMMNAFLKNQIKPAVDNLNTRSANEVTEIIRINKESAGEDATFTYYHFNY
ncbi:uncharacterized protein J8A68_002800 [[Candida] subhashii]|uniref:Uncharacterized protein n=1 Tax=[Candida] subhashii TaxID=561895 RepID=A0A8J5QKI9_9ASCO|nr:uncharacterized protein J8A68_002800 [[Candida] subhashii]KAG7663684.1 hypothetical protein J8A68_002800 [[Candida] subhashii]